MRGVSPLWRSFALVAALSLIVPAAFAQGRLSIPPGAPAEDEEQGRISLPPGAPAEETPGLWTWLMTWFLYS